MDIEEAKKYCKQIKDKDLWKIGYVYGREAIEAVLAELEKKDKMIDEMAEYMEQEMAEYQLDDIYSELHDCNGMERNWTRGKEAEIKDIKEYFTKKVEGK